MISRLKTQPSISSQSDKMVSQCFEMVKKQVTQLSIEVVQQRVYDPQEFIRKHVLESITQLDFNEIKAALQIKEMGLMDVVFECLRDESA